MGPRTLRVAVAQIDFAPAYLSRSVSYLREPTLIEEGENTLSALAQFPQIQELRAEIKAAWLQHAHAKIASILHFCAKRKVNFLVFPEYSVPVEILPLCRKTADDSTIVIVAGSHTIAGEPGSKKLYEESGLGSLNLSLADPGSDIRKSVCPIFIPKAAPQTVEKVSKSVWETDMTTGKPLSSLVVVMGGMELRLGVLLCIDALRLEQISSLFRSGEPPDFLAIPSLSRSTEPFDYVSRLSLMNEIPCLYANGASKGGSKVFARSGGATQSWPAESDGPEKIPENQEAVVIVDVDFDEQFETRRTVRRHIGMKVISYAPLLFQGHSDLCEDFASRRSQYIDPGTGQLRADARQHLTMLTRADPVLFPSLLQIKIRHLIDSANVGSLRAEDVRFFLESVNLPPGVCATFVLRQALITKSSNAVIGLTQLPGSVSEQDRIFKVLKNVSKHRAQLPPGVRADLTPPSNLTGTPGSADTEQETEAQQGAFLDRQLDLNCVRDFVNDSHLRVLIVEGMRGIGKRATVRRVFVEVLPRWRCVWVSLSDGMDFEQLIAELGGKLGLPAESLLTAADAEALAAAIVTRIDSLEATGIVVDDCEHLLSPDGYFADDRTRTFLVTLGSTPSRRNVKVFLISDSFLPLPRTEESAARGRQLRSLEARHARNLFEYWLRLQRDELRGQPLEIPEKLISFLHGHPLAIKIAARLCVDYPPDKLIGDLSIFKKLRKAIVDVLLDKMVLAGSQRSFIEFASVFRTGISVEAFRLWGGDAALLALDSVVAKFLLELAEQQYWMHPAVAHYFYEQAPLDRVRAYHKIAASFYRRAYDKSELKDPALIVEAIYHTASSGDLEGARSLGIHKEQLRALARSAYRRRDWETSIIFFEAISRIDPKDEDTEAHMALCLGRQARWAEADKHFERATRSKPTCWILQSYGAIKANGGLLTEAEELLYRALELNDRDSATLASLAMLRIAQGRGHEAESLFQNALEENPENSFAVSNYAKFLADRGRKQEAKPYAELACELEPLNRNARDLLRKLQAEEETRS